MRTRTTQLNQAPMTPKRRWVSLVEARGTRTRRTRIPQQRRTPPQQGTPRQPMLLQVRDRRRKKNGAFPRRAVSCRAIERLLLHTHNYYYRAYTRSAPRLPTCASIRVTFHHQQNTFVHHRQQPLAGCCTARHSSKTVRPLWTRGVFNVVCTCTCINASRIHVGLVGKILIPKQ